MHKWFVKYLSGFAIWGYCLSLYFDYIDSTLEFYGPYTYCGCIDNSKVFTDGIGCRSCPARTSSFPLSRWVSLRRQRTDMNVTWTAASTDYTQIDDMCFCPNGMTFNTAVWQCPCDDTTQIRDSTGTCVACTDGKCPCFCSFRNVALSH